jgi:peptidoglycan-associated lipoprotein
MRKTFFILPFTALCILSLLFVSGCTKKTVLKEEAAAKEGKAAAESKPQQTAAKGDADAKAKPAKESAAGVSSKNLYEMADIRFDFDAYTLKDESRETLKKHAEWLNKNQKVAITIEGYCDERGTAEYNLALGERRAAEAKKYIVKLGVAEKRVSTVSYGKERPLDPGHDEAAWAKNRRDRFAPQGQ